MKCLGALALLAAAMGSAQTQVPSSYLEDCRILTATPHRLSGTDEYAKAADHVEARLKALNQIGRASCRERV